ncbi:MAG: stress responsive protein [Burkholderiales bacterium RIFCSPLOWO2_12_FULL_64_99]|jgi:quinol monooxygenase YgiN|nr:MAG: stress responsive protein [Burkholderiales bacterium RIFCSPHIGHO2_12_FULL_63_20]OGB66749.1 MAG: stress responsive protein [Burkholderiales bacterium RIFCSPLOWO2_12_FULL_64_99]
MIKHIVLFTLKDPANAPKVKALLDSCKDIVPGIREFEVGIKTEGLEATADVVLVSTFEDAPALAAYQPHPHHQGVVAQIREMASGRQVLDYLC